VLEVLAPGLLSTIQDGGRPNAAHLGVPRGGTCDPWSFAIANLLMGNPADAAVLEMTFTGPDLLVRETCTIALAGSDPGATSLGEGRPLTPGIAHTVWAGSTIRFERAASADGPEGARAYLALAGGIDVPRVLGSASTCLVGGFGGIDGRALQPGDVLVPARRGDLTAAGRAWRPANRLGLVNASPIRVVPGPHLETVGMASLSALVSGDWRVRTESDRMAVRLSGGAIPSASGQSSIISVPMVWGAVQLPEDGQPIVLLADHQTIGGYPVIAVVIRADRPRIGQLAPGASVRFETVSHETARKAWLDQQDALRRTAGEISGGQSWDAAWLDAGG
jgi:antagonist of KipI